MTEIKHAQRSVVWPWKLRAKGDSGQTIAGYAAIFGETADIGGYFRESIAKGAFAVSIASDDVRAYFDHDRGRVLGRSSTGTLRLKEDDKGLAVEIDLPDTSDGRDVATLIQRGDVSGMSFGFRVTRDEWRSEEHTSELQSLMRISYAVFCLKKKKKHVHRANT